MAAVLGYRLSPSLLDKTNCQHLTSFSNYDRVNKSAPSGKEGYTKASRRYAVILSWNDPAACMAVDPTNFLVVLLSSPYSPQRAQRCDNSNFLAVLLSSPHSPQRAQHCNQLSSSHSNPFSRIHLGLRKTAAISRPFVLSLSLT